MNKGYKYKTNKTLDYIIQFIKFGLEDFLKYQKLEKK